MHINRIPIRTWLLVLILALAPTASAEWKEKVLYSFQGGTDGSTPAGGVVFDTAGNLYGATEQGGGSDCKPIGWCGTVFQLKPPAKPGDPWTETVLHAFAGVISTGHDGAVPAGGLVIDAAGKLYGTTAYGGNGGCVLVGIKGGCGTVFELEPPKTKGGAWTYKILYSFQGGKDGYFPWGDLVFDNAGNLYGATQFGGGFGKCDSPFYQFCGTVFELSPPKIKGGAWKEKVLYSFKSGTDGANPNGGLAFDSKGAIYGTTYFGGDVSGKCGGGVGGTGCGTVFALQPIANNGGSWSKKELHRFNGLDGNNPVAGVVFGRNGDLYCTTVGGGGGNSPSGVAVQLTPNSNGTWTERKLHSFRDGYDGGYPMAAVAFDAVGDLYGTTTLSAPVGGGTVFQLRPGGGGSWSLTTLHDFTGHPDGSYPASKVIFDKARDIYGTTQQSGNTGENCGHNGCGTVFKVEP